MFNSDFCMVDYSNTNKVVFLKWKKFCCGDNYRKPVKYALKLLKENSNSNFVVDARNGFEDEKADVEWGISEFIPRLSETDCKSIVFIMKEVTHIEDEMDMWAKAFKKHFNVHRVGSYEEAISLLKRKYNKIYMNVIYTLKDGMRDMFYNKVSEFKIDEESRLEDGNIEYNYYFDMKNKNKIMLVEEWINKEEQQKHLKTEHYKKLQQLKSEYVINVEINEFNIV